LTLGYFIGGKLSRFKKTSDNLLIFLLALAAISFASLPSISPKILLWTIDMGMDLGLIYAPILILGVPLIALGATTPILIKKLSNKESSGSYVSGMVYGVSTIGGVAATFLVGFWIVPKWGIVNPIMCCSVLIFLFSSYLLGIRKHLGKLIILGMIMTTTILLGLKKDKVPFDGRRFETLMKTSGFLGELKIMDLKINQHEIGLQTLRSLYVNNIKQTNIIVEQRISDWFYLHMMSSMASLKPAGSNALLLGFGAGSMADELTRLQFNVDAVEYDERLPQIARDYFFFEDRNINIIVDDARHYIETTNKQYDVILIDLLKAESQPSYIFTLECLSKVKTLLAQTGLLIINFQGNGDTEFELVHNSIFQTIRASGFEVSYWQTPPNHTGNFNSFKDVIYIATKVAFSSEFITLDRSNECCKKRNILNFIKSNPYSNAFDPYAPYIIFKDDNPILESLNKSAIMQWRNTMLRQAGINFITGEGIL
ncbi:MAG: fused MFS/spermidine synthase, partial [Flavobacteriales bacterium]|nr:fused MFS/spermidine synthase [Flavobacteriales bacterium]